MRGGEGEGRGRGGEGRGEVGVGEGGEGRGGEGRGGEGRGGEGRGGGGGGGGGGKNTISALLELSQNFWFGVIFGPGDQKYPLFLVHPCQKLSDTMSDDFG